MLDLRKGVCYPYVMSNSKAFASTVAVFFVVLFGCLLLWKAILWTSNVDGETGKPVKTFIIHIEYNAEEDMISCPGTPGRVLSYTSLPNGAADVECAAHE